MKKLNQHMPEIAAAALICLALALPGGVWAMELGGEIQVNWQGNLPDGGKLEGDLTESLDLEFILPPMGNSEVRYEFVVTKPVQSLMAGEQADYFTKKLYIKSRFDNFHLTVGRQPISWSFGSLLNPVDYTLGAVALEKESRGKYTDGLVVYIPINWNSGVDIVGSFPGGFAADRDMMKWGIRGRLGVRGYDLTINYVREAKAADPEDVVGSLVGSVLPRQRVGMTVKGDVGDFGLYGAVGRYFEEGIETSMSYLVGADYSFSLDYWTKVTLQFEYLRLELNSLTPEQRSELLKLEGSDRSLELLVGSASYPIDDFSSVSLLTLYNLDDQSIVLSPVYRTTLPRDWELTLGASLFLGREDSLFGPGPLMPRAAITTGLSWVF
ncbi:MAG TPA: hypothetical protein GXX47_05815 [Firmicutes bacterium]|nr:hypothetical protein [Bacillota bacterium]